jgi:hypothetical protein
MIIGIINRSGGIGKKDDSTKDTIAKAQSALGDSAKLSVQL